VALPANALLDTPLKDLRSNQNFTIGELARGQVVVLKPMAVW
jgi:hypothetical protein